MAGLEHSARTAILQTMAEAWGHVALKHPEVKFVIQGRGLDVIYDNVPAEQIVQLEWLPIEKYPASLVNVDIGCCSLADTKFNRAKTYIKAMEYGASGAAVVASPTIYNQIIEHGVDGFIANTVDEWAGALMTPGGRLHAAPRHEQGVIGKSAEVSQPGNAGLALDGSLGRDYW